MVGDMSGDIRAFPTKAQAEEFAGGDSSYSITYIPKKFQYIEVEEAPF